MRRFFSRSFTGHGGAYVIGIIGMVAAASYLIAGGLLPDIERNPENPQRVEIDDTSIAANRDSLQLVNIEPVPSPTPTLSPTPDVGGGTPGSPTPTNGAPSPGPGTPGFDTPTPTTPTGGGNPTATPPGSGGPSSTPTDTPQACLANTAINLLIDQSNSMNTQGKIAALNAALNNFTSSLQNNTVIGAQEFAGAASLGPTGAAVLLPYSSVASNRAQIVSTLSNLVPSQVSPDGTYMKNGFSLAVSQIRAAKQQFPNYRFITIVFSDGVPETQYFFQSPCLYQYQFLGHPNYLCFARDQDPRLSPPTPNYVTQMKSEVDKVYSIAIYNHDRNSRDGQAQDQLKDLLQDIASGRSAPYYQEADVTSPGDLTGFFQQVIQSTCPS